MPKQSLNTLILVIFLSFFSSISFSTNNISGEIINVNRKYKIAFTDLSSPHLKLGDVVEVRNRGEFITYLEVSEVSGAISKLVAVRVKGNYETKIAFKEIKVGNSVTKVAGADEIILETQRAQKKAVKTGDKDINNEGVVKEEPSSKLLMESLAVEKKGRRKREEKIKKLSENYVVLSNNLAELMDEKKALEFKYDQLEKKMEGLRKNLRDTEIKNSMFEEENKELKASLKKLKNDGSRKKIKKLKKTISTLKKKLEYMAQIIEGNLK